MYSDCDNIDLASYETSSPLLKEFIARTKKTDYEEQQKTSTSNLNVIVVIVTAPRNTYNISKYFHRFDLYEDGNKNRMLRV